MNQFDQRIVKVRFKRVLAWYVAAAIIIGFASICVLGTVFRDKLAFAYNYTIVNDKVVKNKTGVAEVQDDLSAFAEKSPDLVDILILDSENRITFRAKNSPIAPGDTLRLQLSPGRDKRFLSDPAYPDEAFWLVKNSELAFSGILFSGWNEKPGRIYANMIDENGGLEDDYFFEKNFNNKQMYLLSYVGDGVTGDKIYFISDIQPVANSALYVRIIGALAVLLFMIYWVLTALWIYTDALRSRLHAPIWGMITLAGNLAGVLVYVLYKQNNATCYRCDAVQNKRNVYCAYCGVKLGETCKSCGALICADERFCKVCGLPLAEEVGSDDA